MLFDQVQRQRIFSQFKFTFFSRKPTKADYLLLKPLFDENYYVSSYRSVRFTEVDPFDHFMTVGWREGRNPAAWFDTKLYLSENPDVRMIGINPFLHYVKNGRTENRKVPHQKCALLFEEYDKLFQKRLGLSDLTEPLNLFIPRADLYLSLRSLHEQHMPRDTVLANHFDETLLPYITALSDRNMFWRFGRTVNAANYTLYFSQQNLRYIWIPKVACTTIKAEILKRIDPQALSVIPHNLFHERINSRYGIRFDQFANTSGAHEIAFIRHPIDRLVSCYFDKFAKPLITKRAFEGFAIQHIRKMYSQFKISAKPVERSVSFSEFLRYIQSQPNYLHDAHWRPQADFLGTTSGKTLYRIDGIGRMLRDVGLSNESPIERKNKSSVNSVNESALLSGRLFEKTPNKIAPSDVTSYNDFLSKSTYQQLSLWLKEDFDIFESTH